MEFNASTHPHNQKYSTSSVSYGCSHSRCNLGCVRLPACVAIHSHCTVDAVVSNSERSLKEELRKMVDENNLR